MPNNFYPELTILLIAAGWRPVTNAKGGHEKWRHPDQPHVVIVPRSKSRHTANTILKQAGLPKAF
jgi:predicted RNA binding protein YcfA (HicA-like mRNA interferase family)